MNFLHRVFVVGPERTMFVVGSWTPQQINMSHIVVCSMRSLCLIS